MNRRDILNFFAIDDIFNLPDRVMKLVESPEDERCRRYIELLKLSGGDISVDWFQQVYEDELADKRGKAQFFMPPCLNSLCSRIADVNKPMESILEPTAGTGGMIISVWWERMHRYPQKPFRPSQMMVEAWELSARSIPLLLLNLSIRGMMGYVVHGDTLTGKITQKYALVNRYDSPFRFSDVRRIGENEVIVRTVGNDIVNCY